MDRRDFVVEYRGVLLAAGESLHLPEGMGMMTFFPAPNCDARLLCGGQTVTVKRDRTLFIAKDRLTVTAGTLSGDLVFCGKARERHI